MLALIEQKWVGRLIRALARLKGRLFRHVLRDEIIAHVTDATELEASEKGSGDAGS